LLGRSGAFWQGDYWDRFIRNEDHFDAAVSYIDCNPVKAGLARSPADWAWGSARLRT
jgi:REP element-mobilizing transposase RayT